MGIEDLMNYIYEDQPTKKQHKKKTNKQKDPKLEDKKEDKKVVEPKYKDKINENKINECRIINNEPTEKKVIEKQAKTVKQSKVVQCRPNYVKKTNIIEKKRKYDDHYLQEAKDYYTYQGTINPEKYYFWPQTPLNKNAKTFFPKKQRQNSK